MAAEEVTQAAAADLTQASRGRVPYDEGLPAAAL
jgi:hypothetical protein